MLASFREKLGGVEIFLDFLRRLAKFFAVGAWGRAPLLRTYESRLNMGEGR